MESRLNSGFFFLAEPCNYHLNFHVGALQMQRRSQLPRASAAAPATPIPKTSCKKRAISIEVQCKVNFRNGPSRAQSAVQNVTISRQRY